MLLKLNRYLAKFSILLIMAALIAGMAGCDGTSKYSLTMAVAPSGGGMATDLTNASPYAAGTVVTIKAEANEGYLFAKWEATAGKFANANFAETTFTMPAQDVIVTAVFVSPLISTWYDLDAARHNLSGNYSLINDLDSNSAGYTELASPTANGGKGWQPIGTGDDPFTGNLDGQGYEIRDLFTNRPDENYVGLFGSVGQDGVVQNIGVVNATVTGDGLVGGLVGLCYGNVSDSYSTGSITGYSSVGGLAGGGDGNVSDSYSTGNVTGDDTVGGLLGWNGGTVSNSYSTGSVTGYMEASGGLVGLNHGTVSNSYSTGNVNGDEWVGGLVGWNYYGTVSNSTVSNSYSTGNVTGNGAVGGLVGLNDGNVSNSYSTGSVTGTIWIGGLVGGNDYLGTVSNSYATGDVNGDQGVGGLMGLNYLGTVSNSYYNYDEVLINGHNIITIGALFGEDFDQWLANDKFLDVSERLSQENGYYLVNNVTDFKQLLAFGQNATLKFRLKNDLDLATEPDFYIPYFAGEFDGNSQKISNLSFDFNFVAQVGLFGYLASSGKVTQVGVENVNITGYVGIGGLAGCNYYGTVSNSYSTGSMTGNGTGDSWVGGLMGQNWHGTVSDSYSTSSVTGDVCVGGLVGLNYYGTVSNSYATGNVTGEGMVGGLVGQNSQGTVSNSYSTGRVTGMSYVGGLVGDGGAVSNSFWDTQTSGQTTSDGGTGKNTTEMQDIATFSGAGWNITAVALNETNPAHIWNIVNNVTYPFLSWQP